MTENNPQIQFFTEFAELARTLGHAHRLLLLDHIAQGERSVDRLSELSQLTIANTSQHLQHLKRAGFVQTRRDGKRVLYRLGNGPIMPLLAALRQFADHNRLEIQKLMTDNHHKSDQTEAISRKELLIRLQENSITLLDVRPQEEFSLGHLPGAINIPFEELELRLAELPQGQEVIAYCRGPYCVFSADAITFLHGKGRSARHLNEGVAEWAAAGLYIETVQQKTS